MSDIFRVVQIATSHGLPIYNPIQELITDRYGVGFDNGAIGALGIDTFFPRVQAMLNIWNEPMLFLIEIPSSGRYTEFLKKGGSDHDDTYTHWDALNRNTFWSTHGNDHIIELGEWDRFIEHFNIAKLSQSTSRYTVINKEITASLLRVKVLNDKRMEKEWDFFKCVAINGMIKNCGHQVLWWSFNSNIIEELYAIDVMKKNGMELLYDNVIETKILNTYMKPGEDHSLLRSNTDIFCDGVHLSRQEWKRVIQEYFFPKLDTVLTVDPYRKLK